MAKVLVTEGYLRNIAEAIRLKNHSSTTYRPSDMEQAILDIPTGGITPTGTVNITQNGNHDVTQYANANVNVPNSYAAADEGKVVSNGALVAQTSRTVTENGTIDTTTNDEVVVNVPSSQPNLQSKTVTENGTVLPDAGYDGLSSVVVNVSGGASLLEEWEFTSETPTIGKKYGAKPSTITNITFDSNGAAFGSGKNSQLVFISPVAIDGITIELDVGTMNPTDTNICRFVINYGNNNHGLAYRTNNAWAFFTGSWEFSNLTDRDYFANSIVKIRIDQQGYWHIYKNDVLVFEPSTPTSLWNNGNGKLSLGGYNFSIDNTVIRGMKVY